MPFTISKFLACAASASTALPEESKVLRSPVLPGQKRFGSTPQAPHKKNVKMGCAFAAHAERSGNPSRNGRPIAIVPAPYKKARRLITLRRFGNSITLHLRRAYGMLGFAPAPTSLA